jgi:hypothetical protein
MLTNKEFTTKQIAFDSYKEKIEDEKKYLKRYFSINSVKIKESNTELEDSLFAKINKNPDLESKILDEYEKSFRAINSYYYHSSIALVHTFFESYLILICHIITENTDTKFNIQLLKGSNNILLALDYLKLTTGLEKDMIDKHMPRLGKFQNLRNKIIHENSCFKNQNDMKKLQNGFKNKIDFDESNLRFFINSDELSIEYLNKSYLFILKIVDYLSIKEFIIKTNITNNEEIPIIITTSNNSNRCTSLQKR